VVDSGADRSLFAGNRSGAPYRHVSVKWTAGVVFLLVAGCSGGGHHASPPVSPPTSPPTSARPSPPPVTTRLELASDSVVAGGSLRGVLVVDNRSEAPLEEPICGAWTVELANHSVPVRPISLMKCGPGPVFPTGVHHYAFSVDASYPYGVGPPVGPDHGPPPLAPGDYRAVFVQASMKMPTPAPVPVRVAAKP
jgi:hypothetical protein